VEAFKEAAEKKLSLSDSILIKNEFKSIADGSLFSLDSANDSEKYLYLHLGEKRSISQLLYKMITISSNFSTNLLVEKLGASNITETVHDLGLRDMLVLRGVEDNKAYDKGLNSVTTAYDLMLLFEKLGNDQLINPQASAEMIRILEDQRFNEIIPAELPLHVKVAHKTGSFPGVHHDSGLVILPDGRKYVLVILSKDLEDEKSATRAMADVSAMIYKYVHRQGHGMHY
jgi:beta-lactamase class A